MKIGNTKYRLNNIYNEDSYKAINVADECKDPNELLMKDSNRLQNNLDQIITILKRIDKGR